MKIKDLFFFLRKEGFIYVSFSVEIFFSVLSYYFVFLYVFIIIFFVFNKFFWLIILDISSINLFLFYIMVYTLIIVFLYKR